MFDNSSSVVAQLVRKDVQDRQERQTRKVSEYNRKAYRILSYRNLGYVNHAIRAYHTHHFI